MKEKLLITGANGMLAKHIAKLLENEYELRFLTRRKKKQNEYEWNVETGLIDINALRGLDHIIHLAGAGIADKSWSEQRKKLIYSSRIDSAALILKALQKNGIKIKSFISSSAIGYYGSVTTSDIFTEDSKRGQDFLSDVCYDWERAAFEFEKHEVAQRTMVFRIGIILEKEAGALPKMILPIKFFVGAPLGNGKQYVPWIHIEDLVSMIDFGLKNPHLKGVFNSVAPMFINNKNFTHILAKQLNRPILLPGIPAFILKLILGKRSELLLKGSRVSADKIMTEGYKFKYDNLEDAFHNLLI